MEVTYRRNFHKSYMCIESTEDMENIIEEHEVMILQKYTVPQLLPMQIIIQDGRVEYWFEITGKQSLVDFLGEKQIGTQQLRQVLFSIEQVCRKLPEFLLKEDRICLREELLYIDLQEEKVYFTYLPFWKGSLLQEFRSWMEEVLKHIEHQDRECIELAYRVYEKSREENISIQELLKEMRTEPVPIFEERHEVKRPEPEEVPLACEKKQKNIFKDKAEELLEEVQRDIKEWLKEHREKLPNWFEKNKWSKAKKQSKEKKQQEDKTHSKEKKTTKVRKQKETKETLKEEHTQLLCRKLNQLEGKLAYQGSHNCVDFKITGSEYVIGRDSQQVDGKIETDGISRIHARIIKKGGAYYIEDLSSTNGTYLNGVKLEYDHVRKLSQNDGIRFGVEEYLFY